MDRAAFLAEADRFPVSPGVYIMRDQREQPLYIGKAGNLRARTRSYAAEDGDTRPQVPALLQLVRALEWIATNNESEALILEANLIRTHKPPYNVDLKDDKHYPYLAVTVNEPFPRLIVKRRIDNDGAAYFGPYTDARAMRSIMSYARKIFRIRDCSRALPAPRPLRPCVNFEIGRCSGACAGKITAEQYRANVGHLVAFFKGRRRELLGELRAAMDLASQRMDFETAALYRDQIRLIEDASRAQQVDLRVPDAQCDVFGFHEGDRNVCLAVLQFREGLLMAKRHFFFSRHVWEMAGGSRETVVAQYYQRGDTAVPDEVLVAAGSGIDPLMLSSWFQKDSGKRVAVTTPQKGAWRDLILMAEKNARLYLAEKLPDSPQDDILDLQKECGLPSPPRTIEAFDISNLGESFCVAGMVRFENGLPQKSGYRRYKIRTVEGQNDFAMMMEVVGRRLTRLRAENREFPDLLLNDGGKGQLGAAMAAVSAFPAPPMLISLAKEEETIHSPYVSVPVRLPPTHPARKLVERIRNEVHRWAVTYHRTLRARQYRRSSLESIPGIGPRTANRLLRAFGSLKRLMQASVGEIAATPGFTPESAATLRRKLAALKDPPAPPGGTARQ